ncbi:hypothetical protein TNCV_525731 [Trichonephila clavipes]|nr:hypothetical protein TNCV_525731 [Trichonephila clavipes]
MSTNATISSQQPKPRSSGLLPGHLKRLGGPLVEHRRRKLSYRSSTRGRGRSLEDLWTIPVGLFANKSAPSHFPKDPNEMAPTGKQHLSEL